MGSHGDLEEGGQSEGLGREDGSTDSGEPAGPGVRTEGSCCGVPAQTFSPCSQPGKSPALIGMARSKNRGRQHPTHLFQLKKPKTYLIYLYSFPKQSQAVVSLGGRAEKQHLREELMAPELQTGSGTAWMSFRGPAPTPAPSVSAPRREAEEGRLAAERQGDACGLAPWVPLLLTASHLQVGARICSFSVIAPLLKPAEPRFGLSLERKGASLRAGLMLATCLWAASCGLGEIKSKEKHFFFFP